jgi:predicted deacylase
VVVKKSKSYLAAFSPDYITARERFRAASSSFGYQHTAYPIDQISPTGEALTIDVSISNSPSPSSVVVISSGLHGVEGFLGSAIQLAFLEKHRIITSSLSSDIKVVLIHALNPYGFAWRRRWNEDNIDLNRNFLLSNSLLSLLENLTNLRRFSQREIKVLTHSDKRELKKFLKVVQKIILNLILFSIQLRLHQELNPIFFKFFGLFLDME